MPFLESIRATSPWAIVPCLTGDPRAFVKPATVSGMDELEMSLIYPRLIILTHVLMMPSYYKSFDLPICRSKSSCGPSGSNRSSPDHAAIL